MKSVAAIFARGGSKGLPNKNILDFNGRPLIAWAISKAKQIECVDEVIVSTDSVEIAEVAKFYGAAVPFLRPKELSKDDTPEIVAWHHLLEYLRQRDGSLPAMMLSVPTTAPLRSVGDLERCISLFNSEDADLVVTVTEASRHPDFNMVRILADGEVRLVGSNTADVHARRQTVPLVYDLTTVAYVVRPSFIINRDTIWGGKTRAICVPRERAIDIDNGFDFHLAKLLHRYPPT